MLGVALSFLYPVCRAILYGPYFYIVVARLSGHSLHLPRRRWSPSLLRQTDGILNKGSGYANVALLLLCDLEDAWERDVNSIYVTEQAQRASTIADMT